MEWSGEKDEQNTVLNKGDYIDVEIRNLQSIINALDNSNAPFVAIHSSSDDQLPSSVKRAEMYFHRAAKDESSPLESFLGGEVDFYVPPSYSSNPHAMIQQEILESLPPFGNADLFLMLPHDPNSFYIRSDIDAFLRLEFQSSLEGRSSIEFSLVDRELIQGIIEKDIDLAGYSPEPSTTERFKSFITLWALTIDSIAVTLSPDKRHPKSHLVIALPPPREPQASSDSPEDSTDADVEEQDPAMIPPALSMGSIGGLTYAKRQLESFKDILYDPIAAQQYGLSAPHFLLYGPPGTGKTSLIEAFAHDINASFLRISSKDIVDKWLGSSGSNTAKLFKKAKAIADTYSKPVVIFIDEIETLIGTQGYSHSERHDIVKQLALNLTAVSQFYPNRVILAGATNADVNDLDASLTRSGRIHLIPALKPDQDERAEVWASVLLRSSLSLRDLDGELVNLVTEDQLGPYAPDIDYRALAHASDGMTGADFEAIIKRCLFDHYRSFRATGKHTPVTQKEILSHIAQFYR